MAPSPLQPAPLAARPIVKAAGAGFEAFEKLAEIQLRDVARIVAIDGRVDILRVDPHPADRFDRVGAHADIDPRHVVTQPGHRAPQGLDLPLGLLAPPQQVRDFRRVHGPKLMKEVDQQSQVFRPQLGGEVLAAVQETDVPQGVELGLVARPRLGAVGPAGGCGRFVLEVVHRHASVSFGISLAGGDPRGSEVL